MVYRHYLDTLSNAPLDADEDESFDLSAARRADIIASDTIPPSLLVQKEIVTVLDQYFADDSIIGSALQYAESVDHIMDFTVTRALNTLFSLINKTARDIVEYNARHSDFPLSNEKIEQYVTKRLLVNLSGHSPATLV